VPPIFYVAKNWQLKDSSPFQNTNLRMSSELT